MKESLKHIIEVTSSITLFVLLTTLVVYLSEPDGKFARYWAEEVLFTSGLTLTITIIVIALLNIKSKQDKKH